MFAGLLPRRTPSCLCTFAHMLPRPGSLLSFNWSFIHNLVRSYLFSKCILCVPRLPGSLPREPPAVWSEHFSSVTFVPMHTFHKVWGRQTLCPCPDSELLHTVTCFSSVLPASIVSAIHSQLRKRFLYAWIRECIATLAAHSWEASSCGSVSNFRNRIHTA